MWNVGFFNAEVKTGVKTCPSLLLKHTRENAFLRETFLYRLVSQFIKAVVYIDGFTLP